jgi:hypothetical protein
VLRDPPCDADGSQSIGILLDFSVQPRIGQGLPDEFRQVIESDYMKYGKLADVLKSAR